MSHSDGPHSDGPHSASRREIADRLLTSLDDLVRRHRALIPHGEQPLDLHAELITAEVAHELAVARSALNRHPVLR